jgi:transposase
MCAERTIYTWVTVWRRTGSFKQQHGNTTRNRFKLSEKAQLMVREELDRNGQQTWEQLSHLIWVKTGEPKIDMPSPRKYLKIALLT